MKHVYSFGKNSPFKLKLTAKEADTYNKFNKNFFEAQRKFMEENGRPWGADDPIYISDLTTKELKIYNDVVIIFNQTLAKHGELSADDLHEDYLVKN